MASSTDLNDDDYVASLLAKDARDSSLRYSTLGLQALLPKRFDFSSFFNRKVAENDSRPTNKAPKPNTTFLRNIIRETDNHNAALKKKDELEARMRARGTPLPDSRSTPGARFRHGNQKVIEDDFDRVRMNDRQKRKRSPIHHSERHVKSGDHGTRRSRQHHQYDDLSDDYSDGDDRRSRLLRRREKTHRRYARSSSRSQRPIRANVHRHKRRRRSSCSRSSDDDGRHVKIRRHSRSERKYNSSRLPKALDETTHDQNKASNRSQELHGRSQSITRSPKSRARSLSSDPLESLVGPLPASNVSKDIRDPPVTSRGRGANRFTSSMMDSHFDSSYNPSLDLHPDSELEDEKEDWDMAIEALRDRQLWKQKGAERLRAASFGEDEVKKWEDSGREKGAEDVKWATKGESREWDRGKVVEQSGERKGEVSLEAAWKRKGGGFVKSFREAIG